MATCLREAATAKAGNAAGGFFQPPHFEEKNRSTRQRQVIEKAWSYKQILEKDHLIEGV
jgi:hypothetical protein